MKKFVSLLLAVLMTAALFTGCAKQPQAPDQPREEAVTIRVGGLKGPTSMGLVKLLDDAENQKTANAIDFQMAASANHINADDIWKGRLAAVRMGKGARAVHAGFFRRAEQISHRRRITGGLLHDGQQAGHPRGVVACAGDEGQTCAELVVQVEQQQGGPGEYRQGNGRFIKRGGSEQAGQVEDGDQNHDPGHALHHREELRAQRPDKAAFIGHGAGRIDMRHQQEPHIRQGLLGGQYQQIGGAGAFGQPGMQPVGQVGQRRNQQRQQQA